MFIVDADQIIDYNMRAKSSTVTNEDVEEQLQLRTAFTDTL